VIASVGHITVCGKDIFPFLGKDNTGLNHATSPIEALCMPNGGDFRSQVIFQMTAAALNCAGNGHLPDCSNDPLYQAVFTACAADAAVCAPTTSSNRASQAACVAALDCLNNGGVPGAAGFCGTGNCSDDGLACTSTNLTACANPLTATCAPAANCHQQNFSNFPDSPAGSQQACQDATKTACDIYSPLSVCPQ